ncbi:MAG: site-specific DNA-methyltransferase [Bacilli bacterium]|nr:site-specific DNA-methyltransferase [Bacilli bacterium]
MARNYENYSKNELMAFLDDAEKKLKNKKLGLVWDKEKYPEDVVDNCSKKIPILVESKAKEIFKDGILSNAIIEGDNFHSLSVLRYTHNEKIDIIYIDPPYNTGKDDEWKYNDSYVDITDGYRHSKWLNMMEKRLILSKDLLRSSGVLFISIDDHEAANLKLLCDKVFGEENFIGQICRESIKGGSKSNYAKVSHDYVLVYTKDYNTKKEFTGYVQEGITLELSDEKGLYTKGRELNKWGVASRREDSPTMWFPIPGPNGEDVFPIRNDGSEGRWRLGKKKMFQKVADGDVIFEPRDNGTYIVYEKIRDDSEKIKQFTTMFKDKYLNAKGGEALKKIFKTSMSIFDYAKPVELIKDLIVMSNCDDDAVILDFFAGSGTTGQAVLELNNDDGGNRTFILCTNNEVGKKNENRFRDRYNLSKGEFQTYKKNNDKKWIKFQDENGICSSITYPRIKKIIEGYDFTGKDVVNLYKKKLNYSSIINKSEKLIQEVSKVIADNQGSYDEIEKKVNNNTLSINGVKNVESKEPGLGGNLKYFCADLIDIDNINHISDDERVRLTNKIGDLIAFKEDMNVFVESNDFYQIYKSTNNKYLGIYLKENLSKFDELINKIKNYNVSLYIFSYGKINKNQYKHLGENITIQDIPEPLISIYKEVNKKVKED